MHLAQEKGASSWFTSLPLEEFSLTLHKGAFRDAITQIWLATLAHPITCACGTNIFMEHALSCPNRGQNKITKLVGQ